jgi:tRNA(Ile)-lysidine synthase
VTSAGAAPADLPARVVAHVAEQGLFPDAGIALVAVSGGPDSVALLYLLHDLAAALHLSLVVGHVDHGIHPASAAWASEVTALAARLGVRCERATLALGPSASETIARRERYRALARMQDAVGARYVVTAHHADDQVETVLLRFLRGSGMAGLAGIAASTGGGLVRPLLPFRRAEIAAWLARRAPAAKPHLDAANMSFQHDRSWVRGAVLPLLRQHFPDVDQQILAGQRQAAVERAAWDHLVASHPELEMRRVADGVEVARATLARYDKVLSAALLRALARTAGHRIGLVRAERVRRLAATAPSGRRVDLGDGWVAETAFDRLLIRRPSPGPSGGATVDLGTAEVPGEARWRDWCITWRVEPVGELQRHGWGTWVTPGPLALREGRRGERMRPLGGVGRRAVRRLLMEARVPRSERSAYPVILRGGEVVWVPGVCRSDRALPRSGEPGIRLDARRAGDAPADG